MGLSLRCRDERQTIPRDVVWDFACDGEHGLFAPDHPASFVDYATAMAAGWKESYVDGRRLFFGPCCSGKAQR